MVNGKETRMFNNMTWARIAIVSGLPATAAPVGLSDSGLPVGIQIIGAKLEDRTTIAFARGLSELIGRFVAPPGYQE
jgi:amidase